MNSIVVLWQLLRYCNPLQSCLIGENWRVLEGATEGQTKLDTPQIGSVSSWNHPLDVHWATRGLQGWPQIHLQIYHLDAYSRTNLIGYASASIPTRPGIHFIESPAWRPLGKDYKRKQFVSCIDRDSIFNYCRYIYWRADAAFYWWRSRISRS